MPESSASRRVPREEELGSGFAQILHDRSRATGWEIQKLLISLSTATSGIYFLALTQRAQPPLTLWQKTTAISSLFLMAAATLCGIIGGFADSRRNYFWASALQAPENEKERRTRMYRSRNRWLRLERICDILLSLNFAVGVLISFAYMVLRVLGK
jgi:hypothetical protein